MIGLMMLEWITASSSPSTSMVSTDLSFGSRLILSPECGSEFDVLIEFREPFDRFMRHAVFVLEDAAHPMAGRDQVRFDPDPAADQIGRLLDSLLGIDEDEAMAEAAMQKDRQCGQRHALVARHDIGGAGGFGHVEVAVTDETPVPRGRVHVGEDCQFNAVGLDHSFLERAHDFVVAASKRERNFFRHIFLVIAAGVGLAFRLARESAVKRSSGAKSSPFERLSPRRRARTN